MKPRRNFLFWALLGMAATFSLVARDAGERASSAFEKAKAVKKAPYVPKRRTNFDYVSPIRRKRASLPHHNTRKAQGTLRVMIDVGHGGKDDGAKGLEALVEKELCSKIGQLVQRELKKMAKTQSVPVEVRLTRMNDVFLTLQERVKMANSWESDLFVSIHANAATTNRASGFEVYFLSTEATDPEANALALQENGIEPLKLPPGVLSILSDAQQTLHIQESSRFAETMYLQMAAQLQPNRRGVRQGPFTVLHGTNMPAILVEVGYVTNQNDAKKLSQRRYLKKVANAISNGIMAFAKQARPVS